MTNRKIAKQEAQDRLMSGMQIAISRLAATAVEDDGPEGRAVYHEAVAQFRRIEKLFGYQPNTWTEGV
jgi:predicted glycoside hydrolase/deacetylase ChbG (UPF0249 family)